MRVGEHSKIAIDRRELYMFMTIGSLIIAMILHHAMISTSSCDDRTRPCHHSRRLAAIVGCVFFFLHAT